MRTIKDDDLTDLVKAILAPVRPYGSVFLYSGGVQKSIRGNYHFFEMDQNRLGGVINHLNKAGIGEQCPLWKNDSSSKANCAQEVKS